jgi:signal transduction histidine kinase
MVCIDDAQRSLPTARTRLIRELDVLSGIRVAVDPDQIRQVVRALFRNACEALGDTDEAGTIVVRAFLSDGSIGFSVTHTGDGTARHRRVGMGLSLALELVKMNGGSLSTDNTPGSGTTVTVTFPRRPERDGNPPKSQ